MSMKNFRQIEPITTHLAEEVPGDQEYEYSSVADLAGPVAEVLEAHNPGGLPDIPVLP
jgi:hypothetical protein